MWPLHRKNVLITDFAVVQLWNYTKTITRLRLSKYSLAKALEGEIEDGGGLGGGKNSRFTFSLLTPPWMPATQTIILKHMLSCVQISTITSYSPRPPPPPPPPLQSWEVSEFANAFLYSNFSEEPVDVDRWVSAPWARLFLFVVTCVRTKHTLATELDLTGAVHVMWI